MSFIGAAVLAVVCATACLQDIRYRKLPNWLSAATLIAGLGFSFIVGGLEGVGTSALHVIIALTAGLALYAIGAVGAGDAKFYAGVASWFPLWAALSLVFSISIAGLLLLLVWHVVNRRSKRRSAGSTRSGVFAKLPYGVAIGFGGLIAFVTLNLAR